MKLSYLALVPVLLYLAVSWVPVRAGSLDNAVIALHAKPAAELPISLCPADGEPSYDPNYDNLPCTDYTVTAPLNQGTHVYVIVGQVGEAGVSGVGFGIDYTSGSGPESGIDEDSVSWTSCGKLDFPSNGWPCNHGGNIVVWATCQEQVIGGSGVHAVAGVFYVFAYSEDLFRIISAYPYHDTLAEVASCDGQSVRFSYADLFNSLGGRVHFGGDGSQGYTPCGAVSVERTTWGRIKSAYE